jgi:hypothetical protein
VYPEWDMIELTRFKEHRNKFRYAEGKSKLSEHVLNERHEMKTIEETMPIIHLENNHRKINTLEEIQKLKSCLLQMMSSQDKMTHIQTSPHISDLNSKINSPGQATNKILKTNNYNNQ